MRGGDKEYGTEQTGQQAIARHPRRPAAQDSVSLKHSSNAGSPKILLDSQSSPEGGSQPRTSVLAQHASSLGKSNAPSTLHSKPTSQKHSSGESSNADKWFERSNNNAAQSVSAFDNEPPFFLRNSSSSETPPDQYTTMPINSVAPHRRNPPNLPNESSSNDDFRSVIDDLTIVNKKLRRKLKKYQHLHDVHLQGEKLFEVRFHDLSTEKKKELEETLRKFAQTINQPTTGSLSNTLGSMVPTNLPRNPTTSSYASTRMAESGYVSMSASGQNSSSGPFGSGDTGRHAHTKPDKNQENVRSYLHDIPAGLMPKDAALPMSEKSKKRMVVRRLEQLFAGKGPALRGHQQAIQQEEVAQSAALADSKAADRLNKKGKGNREARIMIAKRHETNYQDTGSASRDSGDSGSGSSPDQRPTRPLDLDPYRAQVPAENMEYIRHLGFSPPQFESSEPQVDGHGWIYLNLLVNMAQLHTINVTSEFIHKAIAEYSSRLELSADKRKVRWKGSQEATYFPTDSSPEGNSNGSPLDTDGQGNQSSWNSSGNGQQSSRFAATEKTPATEDNQLAYVPLFFHQSDSEDELSEDDDESTSDEMLHAHIGSSAFASSAMHSSTIPQKSKKTIGSMIFYSNKANFCTDLTGDDLRVHPHSFGDIPDAVSDAECSGLGETRGPLHNTPISDVPASLQPLQSEQINIKFPARSPLPSISGNSSSSENAQKDSGFKFEVSGLGGVQPGDHFAIKVRSQHKQVADHKPYSPSGRFATYPSKIRQALSSALRQESTPEGSNQPTFSTEIVSTAHRNLPPSELPPPTLLSMGTSSGDYDSDDSSSSSDSESSEEVVSTMPRPVQHSAKPDIIMDDSDDDSESSESDESGQRGFIDHATMMSARTPGDYDQTMTDRLADEIPAGSSAATVGGGSGFNSPNPAATNAAEWPSARSRESKSNTPGSMKRSRTSESLFLPDKAPRLD